MVFPPLSSLIFIQRGCLSSPRPWWRSRERWGNLLLLRAWKFKPALFVTTSSLIPTFHISCVCKCQGSSASKEKSNKLISSCRQPPKANRVTWRGTAGLRREVSRKQTPRCCGTSARWAGRRLASGQETSFPGSVWTNTPTQRQVCSLINASAGCIPTVAGLIDSPATASSTQRGLMELIRISRQFTKA